MTSKQGTKVKFDWMTDRQAFIAAAARTILDAEIPQDHFWDEAAAFFEIAKAKHLRATYYGTPSPSQIQSTLWKMYLRFRDDLKHLAFKKMPAGDFEATS